MLYVYVSVCLSFKGFTDLLRATSIYFSIFRLVLHVILTHISPPVTDPAVPVTSPEPNLIM